MKPEFNKKEARFLTYRKLYEGLPRTVAKPERLICSYGTARVYTNHVAGFLEYLRKNRICRPAKVSEQIAQAYLEMRAHVVRQKTLDADRQAIGVVFSLKLNYVCSALKTVLKSRAYTAAEVERVKRFQNESNRFSTELVAYSGIRSHELATLARLDEQPVSEERAWPFNLFHGMDDVVIYTVKGKGGLVRQVALSKELAQHLETRRLSIPRKVIDRSIRYTQLFDVAFGQAWSQSFSEASHKAIGRSNGGHGLRHTYTQRRVLTLLSKGLDYDSARAIVSSELGHFRKQITDVYLR